MKYVLRSTFEKFWMDPDLALWGKAGLLAISTNFLNSTVTKTSTSSYLLVFGHQPRFFSHPSPQIKQLGNDERVAVMNVARSAAETAHCVMRYLEFKNRKRPTGVDALQPGSLCYVNREKRKNIS